MSKLSFKEFQKLTEKEKSERYKDLDDHDKFSARIMQPIGAIVVGTSQISEEDKKWAEELHKQILEQENSKNT